MKIRKDGVPEAQSVNSTIVKEAITAAAEAGTVFTAGGIAQTTLSTQTAALDIENPSGSGVTVVVIGFLIQIDISGPLTAQFVEDPTVSGATTQTELNHLFGGGGASAVVKSGVNILSGGTTLSPQIFVKDVAPFLYQGAPFILPANKSVSVQMTGQTLTTINYAFNVTWIEV